MEIFAGSSFMLLFWNLCEYRSVLSSTEDLNFVAAFFSGISEIPKDIWNLKLSAMDRFVNYFSRRLLRKKRLPLHSSPHKRIFDMYGTYVWIMTSVFGFEFFDTLLQIQRYGRHSVYSYFMAAFILIIPLWCVLELSSLVCTPGGLYHYSYALANEFVGFLAGWLQILVTVSYVAYISSLTGSFLDASFFKGQFEKGVEKYMYMNLNVDFSTYLNTVPNLLGFFVSIFSAAYSCPLDVAVVFETVAFYCIVCFLLCLVMILIPDLNTDFFVSPSMNSVSTFFSSYYEVANMYPTTFYLLYMGGEVENAEKTIPIIIACAFCSAWLFYSILSLLITLVWDIQDIDSYYVLSDIIFKIGDFNLFWLIDYVAVICIWSALFVHHTVLCRVVVSMARDGLLFRILSRVEKRTRYTTKPSFVIAVFTGIFAIFFQRKFLELLSKIAELLLVMMAPICILLVRYTDAFHNLFKRKYEDSILNEPLEHIGITIWVIVICTMILGYSTSEWTANYFINPHFSAENHAYRMVITGAVFVLATALLLFQKQNQYKSPYKVPLVPLLPILSLLIQSFMGPVLPENYVLCVLAWLGLGVIFYLSYAMHMSKGSLPKG